MKKPAQMKLRHAIFFCFILSISSQNNITLSPLNYDLSQIPLSCTYLAPGLKNCRTPLYRRYWEACVFLIILGLFVRFTAE